VAAAADTRPCVQRKAIKEAATSHAH